MKLNLLNRLQILQMVNATPERGAFIDMSIKFSLLKKMSFSGEEIDKYGIEDIQVPDPKNPELMLPAMKWNEKGDEMESYDIADSEIRYLSRIIDDLDNIGTDNFDTCLKIKEAEKIIFKNQINDIGETE